MVRARLAPQTGALPGAPGDPRRPQLFDGARTPEGAPDFDGGGRCSPEGTPEASATALGSRMAVDPITATEKSGPVGVSTGIVKEMSAGELVKVPAAQSGPHLFVSRVP